MLNSVAITTENYAFRYFRQNPFFRVVLAYHGGYIVFFYRSVEMVEIQTHGPGFIAPRTFQRSLDTQNPLSSFLVSVTKVFCNGVFVEKSLLNGVSVYALRVFLAVCVVFRFVVLFVS